jgi:hypothetical protein
MSYFAGGAIVVIVLLLIFAHNSLLAHPLNLLLKVFSEFGQLYRSGAKTTGAVNGLGLIIVALVGGLIFLADVFHALLGIAEAIFNQKQAHEYVASVSGLTLFITIVMLAALSAVLTMLAERPPRA